MGDLERLAQTFGVDPEELLDRAEVPKRARRRAGASSPGPLGFHEFYGYDFYVQILVQVPPVDATNAGTVTMSFRYRIGYQYFPDSGSSTGSFWSRWVTLT